MLAAPLLPTRSSPPPTQPIPPPTNARARPRRHQKFYALTRPGGTYAQLLSPEDEARLPMLAEFQRLAAYRRVVPMPPGALAGEALRAHYAGLAVKYLGDRKLHW